MHINQSLEIFTVHNFRSGLIDFISLSILKIFLALGEYTCIMGKYCMLYNSALICEYLSLHAP